MTYMHSGAQGALPVKGNSDSMVWKKGDAQRRPCEEYSLKRAPWGGCPLGKHESNRRGRLDMYFYAKSNSVIE